VPVACHGCPGAQSPHRMGAIICGHDARLSRLREPNEPGRNMTCAPTSPRRRQSQNQEEPQHSADPTHTSRSPGRRSEGGQDARTASRCEGASGPRGRSAAVIDGQPHARRQRAARRRG
jgi:hypothetical protein